MLFQIKNRFDASVIFECEADSIKLAVELAINKKVSLNSANLSFADLRSADLSFANLSSADLSFANLRSADLRSANLSFADLRSADLSFANLSSADLSFANLRSADLRSADLSSADLSSADLRSADLSSADLSSANLRSADLRSADLSSADLRSADLRSADLSVIKYDLWAVLVCGFNEVRFLRDALINGKINGSQYKGECACLIGTIANAKHCDVDALPNLKKDFSRPSERFFLSIKEGDTPENNQSSKLAVEWIDEFMLNTGIK